MADNLFKRLYKAATDPVYGEPKRKTKLTHGGPADFMQEIKRIKDQEDYYRMFLDIPAIRGAVDSIVNAVTGNGYKVKTVKKQDVESEDPRVKKINDWLEFPSKDFVSILRNITTNLIVADNSFIEIKENIDEQYGWMWTLDNRFVQIELSKDAKKVDHIIYTVGGGGTKGTVLKDNKFVQASMNKLGSSLYGISSLESLVKMANMYNYATEYNTALFESGGVPAVVFTMKDGTVPDFDRMIEMLNETQSGRSLGLKGDISIDKIGVTEKDMNFTELFDHVTQMVMSVFQVPPIMMSLEGASTKETSKSEMNAFGGKIRAVQQIVNNIISEIIHKIWGSEYTDIRFKLRPWNDPSTLSAIHKIYLTTGTYTPNDVREELDKPPVAWGDKPYNPNFPAEESGLLPPEGLGGGKNGSQTGASGDSPSGNTDQSRPDQEGTDKPKKGYEFYLDELNIIKIAKALVDQHAKIYEETPEA